MLKNKRSWIAAVAAATLLLAGCSAPSSDGSGADSKTLVIYSTMATMPEFAERFYGETGTTLQVISVSSGQSDARVAAEKDNPQADIAISGSNPADRVC